jgi:hypothetical protein
MMNVINVEAFNIEAINKGRKAYLALTGGLLQEVKLIQVPGTNYVVAELLSGVPQGLFDAKTGSRVSSRAEGKLVVAVERKSVVLVWFVDQQNNVKCEVSRYPGTSKEVTVTAV